LTGPNAALGRLLAAASPPQQLAILDAGTEVDPNDPRIARMAEWLDRVQTGFAEPDADRVVAIIATLAGVLRSAFARESTSIGSLMEAFARMGDAQVEAITRNPTLPRLDFEQAATVYLALRTDGRQSHAKAFNLIVTHLADGSLFDRPEGRGRRLDAPNPTLVGGVGPFGPSRRGVTIREFHFRRDDPAPPRFGESEGSVYFLRNASVSVQQVRLEGGEIKYLVRNVQGKSILVGEAFLKKNVRLSP
jgi:hypothetical protein